MFPRRTSRPTPTLGHLPRTTLIQQKTRSERARCDYPSPCYPTTRPPFTRPIRHAWATLPSYPASIPRPRPPRTTSKHTPFLRVSGSGFYTTEELSSSDIYVTEPSPDTLTSAKSPKSPQSPERGRPSGLSSLKLGPTVKHQGQVDLDLERKVRTPLWLPSLWCPLSHISVGTTVAFIATTLTLAHLGEVGCRAFASD
jgi:hypothetical protein